jgi:hypothetical protein
MTDSVAVFDPGYRLTDNSTGAPISGAVIKFFNAGTTTPKTVYADAELATVLGTSVTTDSLGAPTSDGTTKTLIYTDTSPYKVVIETAAGVVIASYDNVKGAVEVGEAGDGEAAELATVVETKSLDYTVVAADQNKIIRLNTTGGDVVLTLPSAAAATIGNNWGCWVQMAGSANQGVIETVSSQTITDGVLSYSTKFPLTASGQTVRITSDGGNWVITGHTPPWVLSGSAVLLTIVDRLAAAPGSPPAQGALYIATDAATWGSTSVANHDLVMHTTGGAYVKVTPPTDCGWMAYVQDENKRYSFEDSAWVAEDATVSKSGTVELATNAETVTATDTARVAPLSALRHHPGMAKCLGTVVYAAGVPTLQTGSVNITSITDTATGRLTVTIADDFNGTQYQIITAALSDDGTNARVVTVSNGTQAAGSFELCVRNVGGTLSDPDKLFFACYGTLA